MTTTNRYPPLCRKKIKKNASFLLILFLGITAISAIVPWKIWQEYLEGTSSVKNILCGIFLVLLCIYGFVNVIKNIMALISPMHSPIGKSIACQLDIVDIEELRGAFAKIDKDIGINGVKYERLMVGKEWILGDEAVKIDKICGIFHLEVIKPKNTEQGIVFVDNEKNVMITTMITYDEILMVMKVIKARMPGIITGEWDKYVDIIFTDDFEFRDIKSDIKAENAKASKNKKESAQNYTIKYSDNSHSSNFTIEELVDAIKGLQIKKSVALSPLTDNAASKEYGVVKLLICTKIASGYVILVIFRNETDSVGFSTECDEWNTVNYFVDLYERDKAPSVFGWKKREDSNTQHKHSTQTTNAQKYVEYILNVKQGNARVEHTHVAMEDIESSLDNVLEGTYSDFLLKRWETDYFIMVRQTKNKKGLAVYILLPDEKNGQKVLKTISEDRNEILCWLANFYYKYALPSGKGWKNADREMNKIKKRMEKENV